MKRTVPPLLAVAAVFLAGCGSSHPSTVASNGEPSASKEVASPPAVTPVPGSDGNKYVVGPFTLTMLPAEQPIPSPGCAPMGSTQNAAAGVEVIVKNTSASFYGTADPSVEFVRGHSLRGPVVATDDSGTPRYGCAGGTDKLGPGQSQAVFIVPNLSRAYYTWQLSSLNYHNSADGAGLGTTVELKP